MVHVHYSPHSAPNHTGWSDCCTLDQSDTCTCETRLPRTGSRLSTCRGQGSGHWARDNQNLNLQHQIIYIKLFLSLLFQKLMYFCHKNPPNLTCMTPIGTAVILTAHHQVLFPGVSSYCHQDPQSINFPHLLHLSIDLPPDLSFSSGTANVLKYVEGFVLIILDKIVDHRLDKTICRSSQEWV